jgi:hypothetical protein
MIYKIKNQLCNNKKYIQSVERNSISIVKHIADKLMEMSFPNNDNNDMNYHIRKIVSEMSIMDVYNENDILYLRYNSNIDIDLSNMILPFIRENKLKKLGL